MVIDKNDDMFKKPKNRKLDKFTVLMIAVIAVGSMVGLIGSKMSNKVEEPEVQVTRVEEVPEEVLEEPNIEEGEGKKSTGLFKRSAINRGSYVGHTQEADEEFGMLIPIPDRKYLFYAKGTGIVYIVQTTSDMYEGYGFMAPFYSKNGNLYRYENGFFTEITS